MADSKQATLSPIDQLMPRTFTRIFLVFSTQDQDSTVSRLTAGLDKVCTQLPYLKGSVVPAEHGSRLALRWSDADPVPMIEELETPDDMPTVAELENTGAPLRHFVDALSPLRVMATAQVNPALRAGWARLKDGLVVCICIHHAVMDGGGVGELAGLWAMVTREETVRDVQFDPEEPLHRLQRLQHAAGVNMEAQSFEALIPRHKEYRLLSAGPSPPMPDPLPTSTSHIFRFSASKLVKARDGLAAFVETASLTVNNILTALVWSTITRTRLGRLGANHAAQSSRLGFAVNGRSRLGADFAPGRYLGNVNLYGLAELPLEVLASASRLGSDTKAAADFGKAVDAIALAAGRITAAHVGEVLQLVAQAPDVADLAPGWNGFHGLDLGFTSWANQDFYRFDFGEGIGVPRFVRVPFAQFDGLAIVLPRRRDEDEIIEVVCFLNGDDIKALEQDDVWKSWA
jgi:trichothecene 3-O-acetyltransferase